MIDFHATAKKILPPQAARSLRIGLREDCSMTPQSSGGLAVQSATGTLVFERLTQGLHTALLALSTGTLTLDELGERVIETEGVKQLPVFYYHVEQLRMRGLLGHTLVLAGEPVARIDGTGPDYRFQEHDVDASQPHVLSRFAYCRRDGSHMVLECALGQARVTLFGWRLLALVAMLAEPRSVCQVVREIPSLPQEIAIGCFQLLLSARALSAASDASSAPEEADPALQTWSFHDIVFHTRSRFGRHREHFGATFRHIERTDPLPAVKRPPDGARIPLVRPDLLKLSASDPALVDAMEARRTIYECDDDRPIDLAQVGELLYRVARVRSLQDVDVQSFDGRGRSVMQVSSRPYPSGGRGYELEFYLTVNRCHGLTSGLYHYDPLEHRLTRLRDRDAYIEAQLRYVAIAAPKARPQVLITLSARFLRMFWKYDAMAYAAILKHVGVVYQSLYLAATAMDLAPCALGSGDSDVFSAAVGTHYFEETSVGEFLVGSRRKPNAEPARPGTDEAALTGRSSACP